MARPATGCLEEDKRRGATVYGLRFRAQRRRHYRRLGTPAEGWTRERAERELADTMALVRKGLWRAPERAAPEPVDADPGIHEFASEWFAGNEAGWWPSTRLDYQWQLSSHLLPFITDHRLPQITIAEVDAYRAAKLAEEPERLSTMSINKTITRLAQILEVAVEYGHIDRNLAEGSDSWSRRCVSASIAPRQSSSVVCAAGQSSVTVASQSR